jgi:hypothetical protein
VAAEGLRLSPSTSATTSADRSVIRTEMRPEDLTHPPALTGKSIRFSDDFHPLDHRFGDRRCRHLQPRLRGPYLHAKLQWQYGPVGHRLRGPLHRYTSCVIGRHHYSTAWRRNEDEWVFLHRRCAWCQLDDPDLITHERTG